MCLKGQSLDRKVRRRQARSTSTAAQHLTITASGKLVEDCMERLETHRCCAGASRGRCAEKQAWGSASAFCPGDGRSLCSPKSLSVGQLSSGLVQGTFCWRIWRPEYYSSVLFPHLPQDRPRADMWERLRRVATEHGRRWSAPGLSQSLKLARRTQKHPETRIDLDILHVTQAESPWKDP